MKWLVEAVEKRLRDVLIPCDPSNPVCRVDLRAGLIELENVRLSSEYLAKQSMLPVDVRDSLIRSVRVKFSLSALLTRRRIEVEMDGIALVLTPRVDPPIAVARAVYRAEKQRAITGAELWQAHARSISASLGAPGEAAGGGGGMRKLRAFAARVAQQALFNAIVRISRVHVRYECSIGASCEPVALGLMVRRLVVTEAPRDHPRGHPYLREHPTGGGNASRAVCVDELAIYCEAAAPLGEAPVPGGMQGPELRGAHGPAQGRTMAPSGRTQAPVPALPLAQARAAAGTRSGAAGAFTPHSQPGLATGGRWDAQRCLDEFDEAAPQLDSPRGPPAHLPAAGLSGAGGEEPSWLLSPISFELRLTSQTSESLDLTRPATTLTLLPTLRGSPASEAQQPRRLSKRVTAAGGAPLRLRLCVSTWQINALEEADKSLTLYVRRQRSRLNGRPEASPVSSPRAWWRYALRCVAASREALRVCTELSGHSWGALWRVLAMRQRYLQLHRRGRYAFPSLPALSPAQAEELLHMEDLLELDTILLFRRFVDWQMVALHGEAAAREAYMGGGGADGGAPMGLAGLRVQGEGDDDGMAESTTDGAEAPDAQLALSDLQSLTQVAVQLLTNGKPKPQAKARHREQGEAAEPKPRAPTRTAGGWRPTPAVAAMAGSVDASDSGLGSPALSEEESLAWPERVSRAADSAPCLGSSSVWGSSGLFGWGSRAPWSWAGGLGGGGSTSACGSTLGGGLAGEEASCASTLSTESMLATPQPKGAAGPWPHACRATPSTAPAQFMAAAAPPATAAPAASPPPRTPEAAGRPCRRVAPPTAGAGPKSHPAAAALPAAAPAAAAPAVAAAALPPPPAAPATPPPLRPLRSALASAPATAPVVSRTASRVSFKPGSNSSLSLLSRTTSFTACAASTTLTTGGEASAPDAAIDTPTAAPNPFGAKEAFLLRPRGAPGLRPQPSRERRVRRKRNHLFAQLHDALLQGGDEGRTPHAMPAWLAHADTRRGGSRSLLSRAGSFTATLAERALGDSPRLSSLRDLRAAQRGGSSTSSSTTGLVSADHASPRAARPRRPARADWQLLGVQGLLYDTWRQANPAEVEALEALTAAAVREAHSSTPPDYTRLRLGFAAPISAELRLLVAGRQKLFVQTDQLVLQVARAQDGTKAVRLLLGPVSAFAITLRLCNQAKLTAAADAALSRLRHADAADAARRPPLPHQTAAAALLDDGRGAFFLSYTKPADTRLRKATPAIRFRLAPDLTADAHLPDGFILNVPNLDRMRELGREHATTPAAAIAAAVAASGSAAAAAGGEADPAAGEPAGHSGGSASISRRVAAVGMPPRRAGGSSSEDGLAAGNLRRRLGTLSFPKSVRPKELASPAKPPRHKRSATTDDHAVRPPDSPKFRRSTTFYSDPTKPASPTLRRSFTTVEVDAGGRGEADGGSKPASPTARGRRLASKPSLGVRSASYTSIDGGDSEPPAAAELPQTGQADRGVPSRPPPPSMAPSSSHPGLTAPPRRTASASSLSTAMGLAGDRLNGALTAVLRPRPVDTDRQPGAVVGPLLLGTVGTLVVPQTAVVVAALLPDSLAVFCHAPAATRAAPPFVYVPVLSARRVPGLIGYTHIEYDMGVVQALGAGEKKRGAAGVAALTGVLRSTDVVARPLFAKRLLEHFEHRRWLRGIGKLDKERAAARDKPATRGCGCLPAGRPSLDAAGGVLEWPVLLFLSASAWLYEATERLRGSADRCLQRGAACAPVLGQEAANARASFVRIESAAAVVTRPSHSASSFFFWSSSAQSSNWTSPRDHAHDHAAPAAAPAGAPAQPAAPAGVSRAASGRVMRQRSWEAEQVAGMVELEGSAELPAIFRLASLQGALEGVAEAEGSVVSISDTAHDDTPPRGKPDEPRKPRRWHLNPFARRNKAKRAA